MHRCYNKNCPHYCEPCELLDEEYEKLWSQKSTPCPIGEPDCFYRYDPNEEFMLLVVGSRTFHNYEFMAQYLDYLLQNKVNQGKHITILSGGADGADNLSERYAKERGYGMLVMKAKWDELGKKAGYDRNYHMHHFLAQHIDRGCVAFWDGQSKGTAHNFELAKQFNTPIKIIRF